MMSTRLLLLAGLLVCLSACSIGNDTVDEETSAIYVNMVAIDEVESEEETFRVVRVIDNLEHPWGMEWLSEGRMVITERPGRLNLVEDGTVTTLSGLPAIESVNQGGLMDVARHPNYAENGWIYMTYSEPGGNGTGTSLARARLDDEAGALTDLELLYTQEPRQSPGRHYGSRIVFPDDQTVIFTIGDRGERELAQDRSDPTGSTIRLRDDGSIPEDNPFVEDDEARPEIFTYGHRNAQGMDIHPGTGAIWQHEHGPRGGDELNVIRSGQNYGWPRATHGTEYLTRRTIGETPEELPDIQSPVTHWSPTSIAPSGMAFYTGARLEGWTNDLFVGALAEEHLRRVVLENENVVHEEKLLADALGERVRDVKTGPDGYLYLLTDHTDGALYRLEPVEE